MAKIAFLFPGQGAQTVGMCKEVVETSPRARELFEIANSILGYDLLKICVEGPAERLDATVISQPALYVAGLAAVEKLRQEKPEAIESCAGAAGLSLGEYTALVFAGALSFEDGLKVVKVRGESMQAAADACPSGMVSVLGLEVDKLQELCTKASSAGGMWIANYLCPGNLAVSGEKAACDEIEKLAPEFGAMKTIRLAVAGAFHTKIMQSAVDKLNAALSEVVIQTPTFPVFSNVDAQAHSNPEEIRSLLVRQVVEPVMWEKSMRGMLEAGFDSFYELGPGRVLAGIMKRVHRKAEMTNVTI